MFSTSSHLLDIFLLNFVHIAVECTPVDIVECMDILPFNMSTTPNPHGLGNTAADIRNTYDMFSTHINNQCHPEGTKVLCSLLHTRCTAETFNLFMAFLETYIPCRSLCLEVGGDEVD